MRVLFISNLFPNAVEPTRGTFNVRPVQLLQQYCEVQVVAPVAWFPIPGKYAPPGKVPYYEEMPSSSQVSGRHPQVSSIPVYHPRALYLPKLFRTLNPFLFARSLIAPLNRLRVRFPFDIIHVDFLYPDACGVRHLAHRFAVPFTVSVAGSDAVWYMNWRIRRHQILRTLRAAAGTFTRSADLKNLLVRHGATPEKIQVIYNGVDHDVYRPVPTAEARQRLSLSVGVPLIIYVGRLSPEKGVADLLQAFALVRKSAPQCRLLIVGDGPHAEPLRAQADTLGLGDSAVWIGMKPPSEIPLYISAADVLCLASHREGVPNVILEANACGTPVVATRVGGVPEVVTEDTGLLVSPHDPRALAAAIESALQRHWDGVAIRQHALRFSWEDTARQMFELFQAANHQCHP